MGADAPNGHPLAANRTLFDGLGAVRHRVALQAREVAERLAAHGAHVGLLAGVDPAVHLQPDQLVEALFADAAAVALLLAVDAPVEVQAAAESVTSTSYPD